MKIGLGVGLPFYINRLGGSSFDADYQALLDASSGDAPTEATAAHQNTMVIDVKAAGVWDKLDLFYGFATDGGDDIRRRNWIAPASFQATLVNTPTFTSLEGYTGNGSNMHLLTGWEPANDGVNFTQNSASIGVYQRTNQAETTTIVFGARDAGSTNHIQPLWNRTTSFVGLNGGTLDNDPELTATGLNYLNRAASNEFEIYSNGSSFGTYSSTSTGVTSQQVAILARNDAGTINNYSNDQVSIFFSGASLVSEAAAFFTAVEKYMDAIGKGVVA